MEPEEFEEEEMLDGREAERRENAFKTLVWYLMRAYRETGEPLGIDDQVMRVVLRTDISAIAYGKQDQLVWLESDQRNLFRPDGDETAYYDPTSRTPWMERIIGWRNNRWQVVGTRPWSTTWSDRNAHYATLGIDRQNKRPEYVEARVGVTDLFMEEWLRLRQLWKAGNKDATHERCRQYSERDWQGWIEWTGAQIIAKFLIMSRQHEDKTILAREAHRYEWPASVLSSSQLLAVRDLIETEKKSREGRVGWNPMLGVMNFDWKETLKTRVTGFVVNNRTSWVRWAYWFQQAAAGFAPNIDEPVTGTKKDRTVGHLVTPEFPMVVFNIWEIFRDVYLERVAGQPADRPEGWKPASLPATGDRGYVEIEDGMRIRFIHFLFDHIADPEIIRWLESEERDGTLTVKLVDDVFDEKGNLRLAQHKPEAERKALWDEWHERASVVQVQKQVGNAERETLKWSDINKMFDSAMGAFWRNPDRQARERDGWLIYIDEIHWEWLSNENLGLRSIDESQRSLVVAWIKEGLGKHRKEVSPFGNRVSWQKFLRLADETESIEPYMLGEGGHARLAISPAKLQIGSGYDPSPLCTGLVTVSSEGVVSYPLQRFDRHCLGSLHRGGTVNICEARRPGEKPREHYKRVRYGRFIAKSYFGWFTKLTDWENWSNDFWASVPDIAQDFEQFMAFKREMIKSGQGRSSLILPYIIWALGANEEKTARSIVEARYRAQADALSMGMSKEDARIIDQAGDDVWIDQALDSARVLLATDQEGEYLLKAIQKSKESRDDVIQKINHECVEYIGANGWSKEGLERAFKEITGRTLDYGVIETAKGKVDEFKSLFVKREEPPEGGEE